MPIDLVAFTLFSLSVQFTPGPNNIMLSASGINHGFLRSLPHVFGISIGVLSLLILVATGYDFVLDSVPKLQFWMLILGLIMLLWLSWRIALTPPPSETHQIRKPISFIEGFIFQAVNPKGWMMSITSLSLFVQNGDNRNLQIIFLIGVTFLLVFISGFVWLFLGIFIRKFMRSDNHYRWFNRSAGLSLALCAVYIAFTSL